MPSYGLPGMYKNVQTQGGSGYDPYEGMQGVYEPTIYDPENGYGKPIPNYTREQLIAKMNGEDPDVYGGTYQPRMSTIDPNEDPDVLGGTYRPTLPPEENRMITIDPGESNRPGNGGGFNLGEFSMQDLPQWLQDALGSVGGSLENYAKDPNLLAAIAGAWNSYNTADKYGEMGKSIREEGNPFGQYRPAYGNRLEELYNDPSSLENSAAYKARMSASMNALGPQLAAKGGGFGNITGQMMQNAQEIASQEYDKEWQRRYDAAGGKFGPDASIRGQLDAARLEAEAKNAALDQLFTPFGKKDGTTINNNNGSGAYRPDSNGTIGMTGANMQGVVSAIYAGGQGALKELGKLIDQGVKYIDLGDGTKIDVAAAARSMGGTDSPGNYGTYPTDQGIGNYGPIEPVAPDPGVVGTLDPSGFTPTDPSDLVPQVQQWFEYSGTGE